ncbi:ubiquitin-like-specific protease 1A [Triticum aestivum]|nr:ubiquitin-like-specific protease 1A [Triticum aestivum]
MDSLNTRIKKAKESGTKENDGNAKESGTKENDGNAKESGTKENDGKRKRKKSKYVLSPFQQIGGRKRPKKSLFGIRDVLINTDYITEDHIEAAKVYIKTLSDSAKLSRKTVVHMTGIAGETCTPDMLQAIIAKKWLHGAVINSYCNHMQTHNPRPDRHILSSWVSHWLILRAEGKVKNSKHHFMEHFTNQTKMVSRVNEEYFIRDKAYFPFHVEEKHWITFLMHNKKKEFQVLNSTGKCSKAVLKKIRQLRAEIAKDTLEVNSLVQLEHPDVSSWPINEYDMPLQKDGVSCGLFVVKCIQNWNGDEWIFDFDQPEVNASRGRILAEILFSECNTMETVKEKILKIMDKN